MKAERWQQINDLFQSAAECAPERRAAFLDEACHGDEGLCREVESLLTSYERAENFIESPAFEMAPELLTNDKAGALVGELIGHYRIESLIGIGGMGEVYLARDERLGRKVALKLLPERLTADETQLSRFKTEARSASALNHPNILTVYEIGAEGTRQFIATEFIEGMTLRASLALGRMNLHDALEIAVQVASALAAAHETGVVHRDIKPENIMLRPDGYVKVLDFGIAKLTEQLPESDFHEIGTTTLQTQPGLVLGTGRYMSPEQTRGHRVDARSDIWSLGVVIYEMVGGIPPFTGETPSDCIASILTTEPPPLSGVLSDVLLKLQSIVQKALRKNSDERYQTIKEMLADLRDLKGELEAEGSSRPVFSKVKRHKRAAAIALVAAMLVAAALAYHFYFVTPTRSPNEKSIAVLPFADLSQGRDQEYFCDGIQEEILTRLAKIGTLKVISRTSTQRYRNAPPNLSEIAKQLGVAYLLEGSVQKADNQVRVNAQLIRAQDASHLWAETYDRNLNDIFAVESQIATKIADTLKATLTGSEQRALATRSTENPEAHQLYLYGRYFWNKRTGPGLQKAVGYFKRAIEKDPTYALAHAGLADAYVLLPGFGAASPQESLPLAKAAAQKALELDDTLAEAHSSLALVLICYDFDLAGSMKEFERAIQLNPNYATAHQWFGAQALLLSGDFDRAIAEGKRAVELDPLSLIINANLGIEYFAARRYDEAIEQLLKTIEIDPRFYYAHWIVGEALEMKGQLPEALKEYKKAAELDDDPAVLGFIAEISAKMGRRDKVLKILAQLQQLASQRYVSDYTFALVHLALGENEKAIAWLERAYEHRAGPDILFIKLDPMLAPLRGHPQFERLVAKVLGSAESKSPAQPIESKSIAVLPFENLSSEPDTAYFADGIQEEILTRLAKIADLKVISRTSTQHYKNSPGNLPDVARQLGVAHVLEGTVQEADGQVRVNVQLINATNDSHLWADRYDRKLTDIFAVESEIAGKIADSLQAKLSGDEQHAIAARPTKSTVAYQLYLKGRFFWNKRTGDDLKKALDYFNQAVAADPKYALPYAGISDVYQLLPNYSAAAPKDCLPKAEAAAKKALELDSTLAEAHNSLAYGLAQRFEFPEAEKEFKRAIELNPNYATARQWYSDSVLAPTERLQEALSEVKRALELDPLSPIINAELAVAYEAVDRYDEAIEQFHKTIELEPGFYKAHLWLGNALEVHGDLAAAIAEYQKAGKLSDDPGIPAGLASAYVALGNKKEAVKILDQLQERSKHQYIPAAIFAMLYLALGNKNEAMRWLEKSYQDGAGIDLQGIRLDRRMARLHGDPRFEKLVSQILPPSVIPAGTTSIPAKSIAVLPFKPLLAASRDESLEIGMADTLIAKLGNLRQIIVRPVSAVRKYAGLEQDPVAAGREQRVDAVLDGTLQKSGERIRVTVRLLSAADGQQLWADKFEEEFTDIFSLEDSISERVAAALAVTLTGADKKQLTKRYTENAEAYQLYLKGRYYAGKYTPEGTKKAIAYFDKAIALDPNYALAYDGLAYCYYASDWFGPPKENFAKGRALVDKALEIDPALAEAHVSLGLLVAWLDYDWPGAEREFKRAFELNANYPPAHLWYGYYLMGLGNFDQSIAEIKRAIELDPLSAEANTCLGIALLDGHRYDEALQQLRTTVEAEPDYWLAHLYFARALEKKGELSAAIGELKKTALIEGAPAEVVSALGYAYAVSGNKAEAEKIILQLKEQSEQSEQSKQFYVPAYGIATIYAGLGDKERAFAYLEKEYANGAFYLNYLKVDPEVDNLRSDPRFADLLRRVRLAP
jgi:TolB-like protein/Tfp pilus assembly protein PilF